VLGGGTSLIVLDTGREVLVELLGMKDEQLSLLDSQGVIKLRAVPKS
jgi:hypothetical protein